MRTLALWLHTALLISLPTCLVVEVNPWAGLGVFALLLLSEQRVLAKLENAQRDH